VPIREQLHNGDIVEILTQKNQLPKSDWLNFVVTQKAKQKIKSVIREEQAKSANLGREELERKLKNWKISKSIDEVVAYLCKYYKQRTGTALYELIAEEKIDLAVVKEILAKWLSGEADEERRAAEAEAEARRRATTAQVQSKQSSDALVIDESINNIVYKLAKCCNPIKGDDIFGFVTINTGITIHRTDCPNAKRMREQYPYRVMEAKWRENAQGAFRVTIAIHANDSAGLVNQITEVVSRDMKLNIRSINLNSRGDGTGVGTISVEVPSVNVVDTLIYAIMRIKGVQRAYRVKN
jgi:GTP pyrophosphokinase